MKRTRRIEITRYLRTVTVLQDDGVPVDPAIDRSAIDFFANEWEVPPPGDKYESDGFLKVVLSDARPTLRRWSAFNFREWLRQKL